MKPARPKPPAYRWPWCDVCQEHVREVSGEKHECKPRQPSLFGAGVP